MTVELLSCTCHDGYKSRRLRDPGCCACSCDYNAIAKQLNSSAAERDALAAQVEQLQQDKKRLDALDAMNAEFNQRNGSNYGWSMDWNCNRIALHDNDPMRMTVRQAIDAFITKPKKTSGTWLKDSNTHSNAKVGGDV